MSGTACPLCGGVSVTPLFQKAGYRFVRCNGCALERIDPAPTDLELAQLYGRHYYDAWGLGADAGSLARLKRATFDRRIRRLRHLPAGAPVLDCGAATGLLMESAAALGLDPYGVELSDYGARAIAERFGVSHVFHGELEQARFPALGDRRFAAVFMYDFIEHVRDPRRVLQRAHALLEPGGTLSLCTPACGSLTHRLMGRGWTHYKTEHLTYFGPDNLRRLLRECGFTAIARQAAWKALTLDYGVHQFEAYPHRWVGGLVRSLARVTPASWRSRPLWVLIGEMLLEARRD